MQSEFQVYHFYKVFFLQFHTSVCVQRKYLWKLIWVRTNFTICNIACNWQITTITIPKIIWIDCKGCTARFQNAGATGWVEDRWGSSIKYIIPNIYQKSFIMKKKHIHHLTHSSVVLEAPQVIEKVRSEAHVWNYWVSPHILDGNSPHISKRNSSHISDRNSARISCKVCFHGHTTMVVQDNCRCNKRGHPKKSAEGTHIFHMVESSTPFHILSGSFSTQKCR